MAIRLRSANRALTPTMNRATDVEPDAVAKIHHRGGRPRTARAARLLALVCLGLVTIGSTGCAGLFRAFDKSECIDEFMLSYRNRALAEKAWICRKPQYDKTHIDAFKDGFVAGYINVASGGAGCCPRVAPAKYWGWRYQSAGGHQAVNAWFAGFPLGAVAAEEDGLGHYQNIRVNGISHNAPGLGPAMPGQAMPGQMMPGQMMPGEVMPGQGIPSQMMPGQAIPAEPEVTNPFYSEPEEVPLPEGIEAGNPELDSPFGDAESIQIESPDSVFNGFPNDVPAVSDAQIVAPEVETLELDPRSEMARTHEAAVSAALGDQGDQFAEPVEVAIDDIFGSSTPVGTDVDEDSDELPFSFE